MSQKVTRRSRRQTSDEDTSSVKERTPQPTNATPPPLFKDDKELPNSTQDSQSLPPVKETEETFNLQEAVETPPEPTKELTNGSHQTIETEIKEFDENHASEQVTEKVDGVEEEADNEKETNDVEMEPLVVSSDEAEPELAFEETSDIESGKESPVLNRCKTRRSVSRHVPTPKTPKLDEDEEELNTTYESLPDDLSTKAEAGGDSTRLDFSNLESNSFLQGAKNKTFGEALRHLSTRRTIRPISEDYRKRILQSNLKNDVKANYSDRKSLERVTSVGIKRRYESDEEDGSKRFKTTDSPGFFARLTSPLASFRNPFRGDLVSSTPKLTGYKDEKFLLEEDGLNSKMCEVKDGQKRWCTIM